MTIVTLSSVGTVIASVDYIGAGTTTVNVSFSSSTSSASFVTPIQFTLDDPMRSSRILWINASTVAAATLTASTAFDTITTVNFLTPIAGVRVTSTGITASSVLLRVLQTAGG